MKTLLTATAALFLAACATEEPISTSELRARYAAAVCTKVTACNPAIVYDQCLRDIDGSTASYMRTSDWPAPTSEADIAECEEFIAASACWSPENDISYWRAPECDFGQSTR